MLSTAVRAVACPSHETWAAAAAVASPWGKPAGGAAPALERTEGPVAVVGPAALMTMLIRGATRNVADALAEALRGPVATSKRTPTAPTGGAAPSSPA